jgi:hypothetical protein
MPRPSNASNAVETALNGVVRFPTLPLSSEALARRLHAPPETVRRPAADMLEAATATARFGVGYVTEAGKDAVVIDRVRLVSRVLRRNLEGVGRAFPFVLTLGPRADARIDAETDLLDKYLLDEIATALLDRARTALEAHLRRRFGLARLSSMAPGSLEDWPIEAQRNLFALLPDVEAAIGVRLTESLLMLPRKSVSGIFFPAETTFLSCRLCPRPRCDHRKAPHEAETARAYGLIDD